MNLIIPKDYNPVLDLRDTEIAIKLVKDFFETELARALNLTRVSAPIMVTPESGLNDNLNGVERPVSFDVLETGRQVEIVHSLAKWKRQALKTYGFSVGEGLYTDMNAIRRDEITDNIHSIFVDQWDWERIMAPGERNEEFLREIVRIGMIDERLHPNAVTNPDLQQQKDWNHSIMDDAQNHGHMGYITAADNEERALWLFFYDDQEECNTIITHISEDIIYNY